MACTTQPTAIASLTTVDAALAAEVHAECFKDGWTPGDLAGLLELATTVALQARDGTGATIGIALAQLVADEAEILTIAVQPSNQRRGIGARLLAAIATALESRGAHTIHLDVAENNSAARALYASSEFVETGRRTGYFTHRDQPPTDAIMMRKSRA